MPLQRADTETTRRFEDGDDWMVLRVELTKGEADRVRDMSVRYLLDNEFQADNPKVSVENLTKEANRVLFEILCENWSLPYPPTAEAYDKLNQTSGEWVDECIQDVLKEQRERRGKESTSSRKPGKRAGASSKAAESASAATR